MASGISLPSACAPRSINDLTQNAKKMPHNAAIVSEPPAEAELKIRIRRRVDHAPNRHDHPEQTESAATCMTCMQFVITGQDPTQIGAAPKPLGMKAVSFAFPARQEIQPGPSSANNKPNTIAIGPIQITLVILRDLEYVVPGLSLISLLSNTATVRRPNHQPA